MGIWNILFAVMSSGLRIHFRAKEMQQWEFTGLLRGAIIQNHLALVDY
jgi:hypothetical protein